MSSFFRKTVPYISIFSFVGAFVFIGTQVNARDSRVIKQDESAREGAEHVNEISEDGAEVHRGCQQGQCFQSALFDRRDAAEGARESGNENTAEQIDRGNDNRDVAEGAREDGNENTAEQIDRGGDNRDVAEGAREDGDESAAEGIDRG